MSHTLDRLADDLQAMADHSAAELYGPNVFHHWRHSPHRGRPESCSAQSRVTGTCGDTVAMFLDIQGETVRECRFESDGCGPSQACAAVACLLASGVRLEDAASIEPQAILDRLPDLPADHEHCANLAARAVEAAVHDYMTRR